MCVTVNDCDQCELMTDAGCRFAIFGDDAKHSSEIEHIVMDWAAKNPEPRYPSWHEAWKQLFPDGQRTPCPGCCGKKYAPEWCGQEECGECKNRPIPAEIAEKLGIKPIGGENR
jgi:hypothetical protein